MLGPQEALSNDRKNGQAGAGEAEGRMLAKAQHWDQRDLLGTGCWRGCGVGQADNAQTGWPAQPGSPKDPGCLGFLFIAYLYPATEKY